MRASLDDPPAWLLDGARGLFARAVADGWTGDGGFVYTTDLDGRPVVTDRLHWVVTEAIGAAATLHAATGDDEYERWYRRCWDFAAERLIDRDGGSWHHELDDSLQPSERTWSGKPDVYHAFQATLIPRLPPSPSLAGALRDGVARCGGPGRREPAPAPRSKGQDPFTGGCAGARCCRCWCCT